MVAADAAAHTLTLRAVGLPHPGPDGNQTVTVSAGDAAIGYVGHTVKGEFSQSGGAWWLTDVWPADPAKTGVVNEATRRIRADGVELGRKAYRDVGDYLPPFALYNQDGNVVQSTSLLGRRLVLNFVFTRCAQPTMCPASTMRMGQLQKALREAKINDVTLVTITFDPEHDTPGVLRQYGQAYGLDFENFQLLTGPAQQINDLMTDFGIITRDKDGILQHTMAVYLVSLEGAILYRFPGENWTVHDFIERIKVPSPGTTNG